MKLVKWLTGLGLVVGVQILAADSVSITSQYSAISASVSLYRSNPSSFGELLVTRSSNDSSQVIGNRTADITTLAEADGVSQGATAAIDVGISNAPASTIIRVETTLGASFAQDAQAQLRTGSTSVYIQSDHNFRFRLDRPHRVTLTQTPTGSLSLVGNASASVHAYSGGGSSSLALVLDGPEARTLQLRLERGEHEVSARVSSEGWGSFNLDQGDFTPFAGDVGVVLEVSMVPIEGDIPYTSGRIEMAPPADGRVSLTLSELTPGRYYELLRCHDLHSASWHFVRNFYTASANAAISVAFDEATPAVFYRLMLVE
jgi:hypothetical protein